MLEGLERRTLREQALDSLHRAILTGQLRPGTKLGEVSLANQLKVSRGTIREALRSLEQSGLVETAPRGLQVKVLSPQEVHDLYATRGALESLAMTTIMQLTDSNERIAELAAALPPADLTGMEFSDCVELDLHFHHTLARLSENKVLLRTWQQLQEQMRVAILADDARSAITIMSRDHHEPIVDALRSQDATRAVNLLNEHMAQAANFLAPDSP